MKKHFLLRLCSLFLTLALMLPPFAAHAQAAQAASLSSQEETLFRLMGEVRARYGLPALSLDPALCRIARLRCRDMLENNYCGHLSPTYGTVRDLMRREGVSFAWATENVGRSRDVRHTDAAFLSSPAHRRNVLTTVYPRVGVGVAVAPSGFVYVCEVFAR